MRDTDYATELKNASISFSNGSEARIERLFVKALSQEEVRLSWWKDNRMMMRPLDLQENTLAQLLASGIRAGVLGEDFLQRIQKSLETAK